MLSNAIRHSVEVLQLRPLRIAMFEEACAGGSGRHVADLASHMASEGHDVHLMYSDMHIDDRFRKGLSDLAKYGGHSVSVNVKHNVHPSDIGAVMEVRGYLIRHGPFDIFHCHSTKAGLVGRVAALGLGIIPTIYTPHAFLTMAPSNQRRSYRGARLMERVLSRKTDLLICVSEEEREHAVNSLGIPEDKLRVIPNGMPVKDGHEAKLFRATVRRELGLNDKDVCIGTVGRLVHQKDSQVLIAAFALAMPRLDRNVKLIVVGKGPLLPKLEAIANKLGVRDRTHFAGELPGLRTMAAFDIFALSSCYEGHPYCFIEALSVGLPIVTTAVGGARISVSNGVNGFICPVGDAATMANALIKLSCSSVLRDQMSRASLKIANDFTLENMMRRTSEVYEGMLPALSDVTRAAGAGN